MKKKRRLSRRLLPVLLSCAMVLQTLAGIAPQTVHAAYDKLHCINPWTGYDNMPVTKGDGTVVYHPQVTYGNDKNGTPRAVFCIDLGAALSSGDEYTLVDPDVYTELNEKQKLAIAYATGNGAVTQPYADPVTGFAGAASTAEAQATLQKFWSTQLMIWYFVEKYDDGTVDKSGLDWAGVEATCNSGWGDLAECNRIWDYVYNNVRCSSFRRNSAQKNKCVCRSKEHTHKRRENKCIDIRIQLYHICICILCSAHDINVKYLFTKI